MVVVFGGNINSELMDANIEAGKNLQYVNIDVLHQKRKNEEHSAINIGAFANINQSIAMYL